MEATKAAQGTLGTRWRPKRIAAPKPRQPGPGHPPAAGSSSGA
jgi:hypothetical protein